LYAQKCEREFSLYLKDLSTQMKSDYRGLLKVRLVIITSELFILVLNKVLYGGDLLLLLLDVAGDKDAQLPVQAPDSRESPDLAGCGITAGEG
jgi:hypothetical protein